MINFRTAAAGAALALFMVAAAPVPGFLGAGPVAAQAASQLLTDDPPASSLDDAALRQRIKGLRDLIQSGSLSADQVKSARRLLQAARAEEQSRKQAGQQPATQQQDQTQQQTQQQKQQKAQQLQPEIAQVLNDSRPASALSDQELRQRIKTGNDAIKSGALNNEQRRTVRQSVAAAREELNKRRSAGQQPATQQQDQTQQQKQQPAQKKPATPSEAEASAQKVLADQRAASSLSDAELRARLNLIRSSAAVKSLPKPTVDALRAKLAADRQELRKRVAAKQQATVTTDTSNQQAVNNQLSLNNSSNNVINNTTVITNNTTINQIVEQKAPSESLGNRDLNRRIRMLRQAERDKRLKPHEVEIARRLVAEDRRLLRQRYLNDRQRRRHFYEQNRASFHLGINVVIAPEYDIAAAEADDQAILDQLIAAPRWQPERAYSFQEVVRNDDLRRAMPGIEIDTVTFDFGSADLGPEQIDQLERVAEVIEKVLAVRSDEIFLIEGHTDAVGSDGANQLLSEARAATVQATLADYFAIDPRNLRTVGLGERFLKIPTQEPEQENRRVTVRRITPLLTGRVQ